MSLRRFSQSCVCEKAVSGRQFYLFEALGKNSLEGQIWLLRGPDAAEQNCQFACHGNDSSVLGLLAAWGSQMTAPPSRDKSFPCGRRICEPASPETYRLTFQHKTVRNSILLQDLLRTNPLSSPEDRLLGIQVRAKLCLVYF